MEKQIDTQPADPRAVMQEVLKKHAPHYADKNRHLQPPKPNEPTLSPTDIPAAIYKTVDDKLERNAKIHPARENGRYKGKIIYNDERYIVQSIGLEHKSAVVHRKENIEFKNDRLKWRDENNRLNHADIQVHYQDGKALAYPWNKEKEQKDYLMSHAKAHAEKHIGDETLRESFLNHVNKVAEIMYVRSNDKNKQQAQQEPQKQEHEIER